MPALLAQTCCPAPSHDSPHKRKQPCCGAQTWLTGLEGHNGLNAGRGGASQALSHGQPSLGCRAHDTAPRRHSLTSPTTAVSHTNVGPAWPPSALLLPAACLPLGSATLCVGGSPKSNSSQRLLPFGHMSVCPAGSAAAPSPLQAHLPARIRRAAEHG